LSFYLATSGAAESGGLSTSDIIALSSSLFTSFGVLIAIFQLHQTNKIERARFVRDIASDVFGDTDLRDFFYKIDYEKFLFDQSSFRGSKDERLLDTLLIRYDSIAKLVRLKVLSLDDIEPFMFDYIQIFKNKDVDAYLQWLRSEFEIHGRMGLSRRAEPFYNALWLLKKLRDSGMTL
jgi:hypothetical protein